MREAWTRRQTEARGCRTVRTAMGVWRWRRNPLRRPTDLFEAWVAFAAVICVLLVAPAVGWATGLQVDGTLQRAASEQRQERQLVPAVVLRTAPDPPAGAESDPTADRQTPARTQVVASWIAPDGTSRQGTVPAAEEPPRPGDRFRMWTDSGGGWWAARSTRRRRPSTRRWPVSPPPWAWPPWWRRSGVWSYAGSCIGGTRVWTVRGRRPARTGAGRVRAADLATHRPRARYGGPGGSAAPGTSISLSCLGGVSR